MASSPIRTPFDAVDASTVTGAIPHADYASAVSKVSRRLLWFLFVLFVFSFLDRINIGFAGLTMTADLGLTATMFGFATTVFYIAYVCCGIPANLALACFGARRWISYIMVAWGVASTATLFAQGAHSLYALRALVGVAEAGFLPGILAYLVFWFPSGYRARANALFMTAMPVTTALGSVASGYLLGLDGKAGLAGWQWLFAVEGLPAALLGIAVWLYLDDRPSSANWLTPAERAALQEALDAESSLSGGNAPGHETGLVRALLRPSVLKFAVGYFCLVNTLSMVSIWVPQIVKSFNTGSNNMTIGLLAAIPQVCTVIGMIWWGRRSDHRRERKWHLVVPMLAAAAGWVVTAYAGDSVVRLFGICVASTGSYTAMAIFWTVPDRVLPASSRIVGIALVNAIGNIGSAFSSIAVGWLRDHTHSFTSGLLFATSMLVIGSAILLALPWKTLRH